MRIKYIQLINQEITTDIGFLRRIFTDDNEWMNEWNEMISMRTEKK